MRIRPYFFAGVSASTFTIQSEGGKDMNLSIYITTIVVALIALLVVAKNFYDIKKPKKHATKEEDAM